MSLEDSSEYLQMATDYLQQTRTMSMTLYNRYHAVLVPILMSCILIGFFPQFFAVIAFITPILAVTTVLLFMDKFPETYTVTFTLASLALATALCIIAYLTQLSAKNPNPRPPTPHHTNRLDCANLNGPQRLYRFFLATPTLHHALLVLTLPEPPSFICPLQSNLDYELLSWSDFTVICLCAIAFGAALQLKAYNDLGRDFAFALSKPSRLVKSGIYAWIQHPSYTGQMLVLSGNLALFMRFGGLCCWIQIPHRQTYEGWGIQFYTLVLSLRSCALSERAKNEENMLKEVFGQEWVEWASRTPRVLPGII